MRASFTILLALLLLNVQIDFRQAGSFSWTSDVRADSQALRHHQGRYFRVAVPQGWSVNETTNGVEVTAPDGVTGTVYALLMGAFGQMTPRYFLMQSLQSGPYVNPQIEWIKDLPNQPGPMGMPWQVVEARLHYGYRGMTVRAHVIVGVVQGYGQYSAILRAYQAPPAQWPRVTPTLAAIDNSVLITNTRQVAGLDQVQLPKGASYDEIYGDYNKAWDERQSRQDRLSKERHEATMEYQRMKDPETGQFYDMPQSAYDPTVQGYRNPKRPTELLVPAEPGE